MNRLMERTGEKTQERSMTITTYSAGPDKIVMEGALIDRRFTENYLLTGEKKPVGVFHHLVLRMLINAADRQIEDVDVELVAVPREECLHIKNSLDLLKGEKITSGFMRRIQTLIRKDRSCAHLRTLLVSMSSTAILGLYSILSKQPLDLKLVKENPKLEKIVLGTVMDTCYVWREKGPEFQRLADMIDDAREK